MLAADADGAVSPGLLLFPNFLSLKQWDYAEAERIAALGYTVLATDYYGQGKRGVDIESGGKLKVEINNDRRLRDRVVAALETIKQLPAVNPDQAGRDRILLRWQMRARPGPCER